MLLLLHTWISKLHAKWQGLFRVTKQVVDVDSDVRQTDKVLKI